jgi:hypothetical protein
MSEERFSGTAYSYIRFSAKEQEKGDSIRRQRLLRQERGINLPVPWAGW